jgi:predicted glutamine amidotransferase
MCRWVLFFGSEKVRISTVVLDPEHSLLSQSKRGGAALTKHVQLEHLESVVNWLARNHQINGDGAGIAFFVEDGEGEEARIGRFRTTHPAWSSENLRSLAQVIQSRNFFGHIRASTSISQESNCHPFIFGCVMFMHNGAVAHIEHVRRSLLDQLTLKTYQMIRGTTDSEVCGALCYDFLVAQYGEGTPYTAYQLATALRQTIGIIIATLDQFSRAQGWRPSGISSSLNFAISSRIAVAVSRFRNAACEPPSLFYQLGSSLDQTSLLVASEPFLNKSDWKLVPSNTIFFFDRSNQQQVLQSMNVEIPKGNIRARLREICRKYQKAKVN